MGLKSYFHPMLYENLELKAGDLPDVVDVPYNAHPRRYLKFRIISLVIVFTLVGIGLGFIWMTGNMYLSMGVSIAWFLLLSLFIGFELRAFPRRGYLVRERDISYRSGLIFRDVVTVPYNRIQHSEVSSGPLERKMTLSTLKIYTAGGSSSDLSIHGLEPDEAMRIKEWLTEKTAQHA